MRSPIQMQRPVRTLATCLVVLSALVGCGRSRFSFLEIYRDETIQVRLVEWKDGSGSTIPRGFDHPWPVDAQTLEGLLSSIRYRRGLLIQRNKARDVFPADVRKGLLGPLREAFERAGPDQAVDFSFLRRETTLAVFQRDYLTDGILFRKGGAFHCALRNLAFETLGGPEGGENPFAGDPTEKPLRSDWTFVLQEGQSLARSGSSGLFAKEEFPNWIVLDLARSVGGAKAVSPEATEAPSGVVPAEPEGAGVPPTPMQSLPPHAAPAVQTPVSQPSAVQPEVEDRLRFLEELRREGSLSEEAYQQKKRELLERGVRETAPAGP